MNNEQMLAKIAELEKANALLAQNQKKDRALSFKVSDKGAVSIYGLNRFPVTLYANQWEKLIAVMPQLKEFITANMAVITEKTTKAA